MINAGDNILTNVTIMIYPTYYRKGTICIKRESPRRGKQVDLSETGSKKPFQIVETNDKLSFDRMVESMERVSFEIYERYLILLHKKSQLEAKTFRQSHARSPEFINPLPRTSYE